MKVKTSSFNYDTYSYESGAETPPSARSAGASDAGIFDHFSDGHKVATVEYFMNPIHKHARGGRSTFNPEIPRSPRRPRHAPRRRAPQAAAQASNPLEFSGPQSDGHAARRPAPPSSSAQTHQRSPARTPPSRPPRDPFRTAAFSSYLLPPLPALPPRPCCVPEVEPPQRRERRDADGEGGGAVVAHPVVAALRGGKGRSWPGEVGGWGERGACGWGRGERSESRAAARRRVACERVDGPCAGEERGGEGGT